MKNSKKSPEDQSPSIAISIEGVNQELDAFRGVPSHELGSKNFHVDSARRNAACDLREARVTLALTKLRSGKPSGTVTKDEADLTGELEEIATLRKLGTVFESVARAASELGEVASQAKPHFDRLNELTTQADAMKTKLAGYQARDVRQEMSDTASFEDEKRWVSDFLEGGNWRRTALDFRDAAFEQELLQLSQSGRYTGEITREGAEARLVEITRALETLNERVQHALDANEMQEVRELPEKILILDRLILEETRYSHFAINSTRFREGQFSQLLEAAKISAESAVESYQINRERIALQVA